MATRLQDLSGTFTTGEARRHGVHPRVLYRGRDDGEVIDLSRGVFRRADAPPASYPDLLAVTYRAPRAVVCCVSAAATHDLTDLMRLRHRLGEPLAHAALHRWLRRPDARPGNCCDWQMLSGCRSLSAARST